MTDFIDQTIEREDHILQLAVNAARRATLPPTTGKCFNCGDPVPVGRFCPGGECHEDWTRRQRVK